MIKPEQKRAAKKEAQRLDAEKKEAERIQKLQVAHSDKYN